MQTTITLQLNSKRYDLMLDDQQTIAQGLEVLRSAGQAGEFHADFYRACCAKRVVSAYQPIAELRLYSGELLEAIS